MNLEFKFLDEDAENITTIGDAVNYITEHQANVQKRMVDFLPSFFINKEIKYS